MLLVRLREIRPGTDFVITREEGPEWEMVRVEFHAKNITASYSVRINVEGSLLDIDISVKILTAPAAL